MKKTWSSRVVVLLLVFFCCCVTDSLQCSQDGPEDCEFGFFGDTCSWTSDGGWAVEYTFRYGYYAALGKGKKSGLLTSRLACRTRRYMTYCLSFKYLFPEEDKIDLSVYVTNNYNSGRYKLWSLSKWSGIGTAYVPIVTNFNFSVQFEAVRRSGSNNAIVYIDAIKYEQNSSCSVYPSEGEIANTTVTTADGYKCTEEGPETCWFTGNTWCSWTSDGGWTMYANVKNNDDLFPGLSYNSSHGILTSRQACSTEGRADCLSFSYWSWVPATLDVYITNSKTGNRLKVWSRQPGALSIAYVPIETNFLFYIELELSKLQDKQSHKSMYIDTIYYWKNSSCPLFPPSAAVPTTSTVPSTDTSTAITTAQPTTTGSPTQNDTGNTASFREETKESEASTEIAPIIGGVIAVIAVIAIVVIIFILYRRNKLQTFKNLFSKQKPTETFHTAAAHNVAYNLDAIGIEDSAIVGVNGSSNQHVASEHSMQSSGDYYSTIHTDYGEASAQNSSTPDGYAVVNKPKGAKKHLNQPEKSIYHTPEATEDIYYVEKPNKSGSKTTDEYNELDFDSERKGVQEHTDGEAGAVYSHLREGDEDAYNEVDRERRTDVIDDEYSHTQQN